MKRLSSGMAAVFLSVLVLVFVPVLSYCQGGIATDPDAPIDGGVGVLVAAGIGYGVKKMRDARKKKTLQD